jgi:hypothetical protein
VEHTRAQAVANGAEVKGTNTAQEAGKNFRTCRGFILRSSFLIPHRVVAKSAAFFTIQAKRAQHLVNPRPRLAHTGSFQNPDSPMWKKDPWCRCSTPSLKQHHDSAGNTASRFARLKGADQFFVFGNSAHCFVK